jgi:hypothetical protein
MTLTGYTKYAEKSKAELIEEIIRLNKEIKGKNEEIALLKKRLSLYKSIK